MLVSFIIPSYNSAGTVVRCLDSIYALPLNKDEFEVIFIDDCSKDNTVAIVEGYAQTHANITLLRQPSNKRQGAARNRGVIVAKGTYICFVDSDYAVTEGILDAICLAKDRQAEMTAFHFANANEQGTVTKEADLLNFAQAQTFSGIEMQNTHRYWCSAPWGFIYSNAFLHRVHYPFYEGALYEDSDFVAVHLYYAQRMAYSSKLGYIAYYREGSTTRGNNYRNAADYLLLGSRMLAFHTVISRDVEQNNRTEKGIRQFADGILEGACYNVTRSLNSIFKLDGLWEVRADYDRVDARVDRRALYKDKRLYKYSNYWNILAGIGIRYKYLSILLNTCLSVLYKGYMKIKVLVKH